MPWVFCLFLAVLCCAMLPAHSVCLGRRTVRRLSNHLRARVGSIRRLSKYLTV